jgi:hypothetical protein
MRQCDFAAASEYMGQAVMGMLVGVYAGVLGPAARGVTKRLAGSGTRTGERAAERAALRGEERALSRDEGFADLEQLRTDLRLEDGKGTLARLDAGGQTFYGINAHGTKVSLTVNPISATHAETDVMQQAATAGVRGGPATIWVDRDLCAACGRSGALRSLARQLGFSSLTVHSPSVSFTMLFGA